MQQYYLFYKPFQVLCQFSREGEKKTLADYLFHLQKDIYPAGRLDFDSEGLLLLTNDKALQHRLLEPRFAHKRTYWVQVEGIPTENALQQLRDGVNISIDGKPYTTKPAEVSLFTEDPIVVDRDPPIRYRKEIPSPWISLTLTEGKNRQVRRMTAAVGFPTLRLIRYSIGKITIDGLQAGKMLEISSKEAQMLLIS
ncbi:MAG: pseudouridine synthase [Bacteroidota bacterium]